jgi:hypothetical protein
MMITITLGAAGAGVQATPSGSADPGCSVATITSMVLQMGVRGDSPVALKTAQDSAQYAAEKASLTPSEQLSYAGMFNDWTLDKATCMPAVQSIDVVFAVSGSSPPVQFVILENPQASSVIGTTLHPALPNSRPSTPDAATATWSGWDAATSGGPVGSWTLPTASAPTGGCGTNNVCYLYIWIGQTAQLGGGTGISQAGSADVVQAGVASYWDWYEFFYPASIIQCRTISPGDTMKAFSSYSAGTYSLTSWDMTTGTGCTSSHSMSMGAPNYADFIAENPTSDLSQIPHVPSFTLYNLNAGSSSDLLDFSLTRWNSVTHLSSGNVFYVSGASQFTETYS